MAEEEDWKDQNRKNLIDLIMREIYLSKDSPEAYLHIYYSLAIFGLHIKVEKLGLLEQEAWQKRENTKELIESIKAFLWKEIR